MMVRWMCGVTLKDRKSSAELLDLPSVVGVGDMVRRGRLRWFGHVERKMHASADDWVSKCRFWEVDGGGLGMLRERCMLVRMIGSRNVDSGKYMEAVWAC